MFPAWQSLLVIPPFTAELCGPDDKMNNLVAVITLEYKL